MTNSGEVPTPDYQPKTVVCANCGKPYRYEMNILSGEYPWFKPRKSKGCTHEVIPIDGELHVAEVKS